MFSQLFYFFALVCVLSQANLYVSGSFLGDLFRAGANANYQLADVSDDAVNRFRDMFQPPVDIYGKGRTGPEGKNVAPANSYDYYRSFAPSGNVGGQVDMGALLPSASKARLAPPYPIVRYLEN